MDRVVPELPARQSAAEVWHPMVLAWWRVIWQSPMASEYLEADTVGGLYLLAELHQVRWTCRDASALIKVASEIRQQEIRFGLSPIDRRRLQWEVERGETANERTKKRQQRSEPASEKDPRDVLRLA